MQLESNTRSAIKAVSYRLVGTLTTGGIVFMFTNELKTAAAVGALEALSKIVIFFFHERLWERIRFGRYEIQPMVIWITGLSGSGKTSIGEKLTARLKAKRLKVEHIDGVNVRKLIPASGYTRSNRIINIERIALLARYLERNGIFVVCTLMAPYEESRKMVRGMVNQILEVHVATPLDVCEKRDNEGLYQKAREGKIQNFVGIHEPYEHPTDAHIVIDTSTQTEDEAAEQILSQITARIRGLSRLS